MSFGDDEESLAASPSHPDYARADHGKKKELQSQMKREFGKDIDENKITLGTGVHLSQLKDDLAGNSDAEQKRKEQMQNDQDEQDKGFGTKTNKQEEEESIQTADEDISPEKLIEQAEGEQQEKEDSDQEYQAQMG